MNQHRNTFKAACIQMCSSTSIEENKQSFIHALKEAAGKGATYVQTPEMTNIVEKSQSKLLTNIYPPDQDPVFLSARELARQFGIYIHLGSLALKLENEQVANRAYLIDPNGETLAQYDKIHMFDVDLPNGESWRESKTYQAGDQVVTAQLPQGIIGLSICYDIRFPALYQALVLEGNASILSAPAAFTRQTGKAHWHVLQRARAIETGTFMISSNQGGDHADGRETYGHSIIIDPWGNILAERENEAPGIIYADIDCNLVQQARQKIPNLMNRRSFHFSTSTTLQKKVNIA